MKNIIITLFSICSTLICCQEKNMNNLSKNTMIKDILENQIKHGISGEIFETDISTYTYSEKDLEATIEILQDELKRNGYQFVNNDTFNIKIQNIFKRILIDSISSKYVYLNFNNICDKNIEFYRNDNTVDLTPFSVYIIKNKNFITQLYAIPEIIDYSIALPEVSIIENDVNTLPYNNNEKIRVIKWKDISDLSQQRYNNIQTLVNRNKYLFNDNKASFVWLKFNDTYFLESLVKTFGYMNDKELLKWVIDKTLSDKNNKGEDFNSLFFMKDCSNKFVFHKETFEVLKENINNKMLEALENYVYYREENKELQTLPFKQKAQVLAYVLYIGEYFAQQEKYSSRFMFKFMGTFYEFDKEGDKYDEEFKTNNYYNLSDFKKLWEQAKEEGDGIGLPM